MAMPNTARRYTVDEVLAFPPDRNRYELVHGELLVTPSPSQRHEVVRARLFSHLIPYLAAPGLHVQFFTIGDVFWSEEDYVQPDMLVVPAAAVTGSWRDVKHLLLAVEVVSPSSVKADRITKRRLYQERGVETYWVVDAAAQLVEVWHPEDARPEVVADTLRWRVAPEAPELVINLAELFADLPPARE
jgi:Uma2 family endonuclease